MGVTLLFSFSDLGMLFIELRGATTIDHPAPPPEPPLQKNNLHEPPPPRLLHVHTQPPAHRETEQNK